MRYLGGKSRTAGAIADVIRPTGLWWDPFCGGLASAVALAKYGPGIVSDANAALIALYQAVRDGWDPPTEATEEEWHAAKALPDSDPRKAMLGVGCSYGGMWFSSPNVKRIRRWNRKQSYWCDDNAVGATRTALLRDVSALAQCSFQVGHFLTLDVPAGVEVVYCDPPYAGTTGYKATGPFDHAAFWARCQELAETVRVFVSEYACPVPHEEVWSRKSGCMLSGTGSGLDARADPKTHDRVERLFRVLPLAAAETWDSWLEREAA